MKKIYPTLTVLSIFFLFTGLILAQQTEQPTPGRSQAKSQTFDGELAKVDTAAKKLSVKGSGGKEMEFGYTDQTQIIGAEGGVEGLASKSGTQVRVHYDAASKTASKIEVQSKQRQQ